jgi:hypothetical protein
VGVGGEEYEGIKEEDAGDTRDIKGGGMGSDSVEHPTVLSETGTCRRAADKRAPSRPASRVID